MFIKQERPVLPGQHAWDGCSLRGGHQHLDVNIHQAHDNNLRDAVALRSQPRLRTLPHERRRFKVQRRRHLETNKLTQQDIIAWTQGLFHSCPTSRYSPEQQDPLGQQSSQTDQSQAQVHPQKLVKMEDGNYFPYMVANDRDSWSVGDSYGNNSLPDMPTSSMSNGPHQTTGGFHVSGRDFGPSHIQNAHQHYTSNNNRTVSQQHVAWPMFQDAYIDKYSPPPFAAIDSECPRQHAMPTIFGDQSSTNYMGMYHGQPSNGWPMTSSMPTMGEQLLCNGQFSPPATTYGSCPSSSASEAMAAINLDTPILQQGLGSMNVGCPPTISPNVLRINPSPAPTMSSEVAHPTLYPTSDYDFSCGSLFEQRFVPPPGPSSIRPIPHGRKALPEKSQQSRYISISDGSSGSSVSPNQHSVASGHKHLADIKPKPVRSTLPEPPSPEAPVLTAQVLERNKQNEFLVQSKLAGMTYREIKREGGFKEAESTLRGRYRTLTKHKTARVRKPEWTDKDIELLQKAVRKLTKGADPTTTRIPWKQVSAYIAEHGGSYNFGYSTCSKRWEELMAQENST